MKNSAVLGRAVGVHRQILPLEDVFEKAKTIHDPQALFSLIEINRLKTADALWAVKNSQVSADELYDFAFTCKPQSLAMVLETIDPKVATDLGFIRKLIARKGLLNDGADLVIFHLLEGKSGKAVEDLMLDLLLNAKELTVASLIRKEIKINDRWRKSIGLEFIKKLIQQGSSHTDGLAMELLKERNGKMARNLLLDLMVKSRYQDVLYGILHEIKKDEKWLQSLEPEFFAKLISKSHKETDALTNLLLRERSGKAIDDLRLSLFLHTENKEVAKDLYKTFAKNAHWLENVRIWQSPKYSGDDGAIQSRLQERFSIPSVGTPTFAFHGVYFAEKLWEKPEEIADMEVFVDLIRLLRIPTGEAQQALQKTKIAPQAIEKYFAKIRTTEELKFALPVLLGDSPTLEKQKIVQTLIKKGDYDTLQALSLYLFLEPAWKNTFDLQWALLERYFAIPASEHLFLYNSGKTAIYQVLSKNNYWLSHKEKTEKFIQESSLEELENFVRISYKNFPVQWETAPEFMLKILQRSAPMAGLMSQLFEPGYFVNFPELFLEWNFIVHRDPDLRSTPAFFKKSESWLNQWSTHPYIRELLNGETPTLEKLAELWEKQRSTPKIKRRLQELAEGKGKSCGSAFYHLGGLP